jgi:hypothetical protein
MNFQRLGIGNTIFLAFNLLAIVVGFVLLITSGASGPLILLIVGAIGLAVKKLVQLFELEERELRGPDGD